MHEGNFICHVTPIEYSLLEVKLPYVRLSVCRSACSSVKILSFNSTCSYRSTFQYLYIYLFQQCCAANVSCILHLSQISILLNNFKVQVYAERVIESDDRVLVNLFLQSTIRKSIFDAVNAFDRPRFGFMMHPQDACRQSTLLLQTIEKKTFRSIYLALIFQGHQEL